MAKKPITIIVGPEPKFLFTSDSGKWAAIVGVASLINGGTPQVPDELDADDAGRDATYHGQVTDDMPEGIVDLNVYAIPRDPLTPGCKRCDTGLDGLGYCTDETCPFSDHTQDCTMGWAGHPESPQDIAKCTCGGKEQRHEKMLSWLTSHGYAVNKLEGDPEGEGVVFDPHDGEDGFRVQCDTVEEAVLEGYRHLSEI